jgi:hypothetical protein
MNSPVRLAPDGSNEAISPKDVINLNTSLKTSGDAFACREISANDASRATVRRVPRVGASKKIRRFGH